MKTYRPPQAVCEEAKLDGSPLTLPGVHQLYKRLVESESFNDSLRWCRRILHQEDALTTGLAKSSSDAVMIPSFVDLQLGPQILVGITKEPIDKVADLLTTEETYATCVQTDQGTLVMVSYDKACDQSPIPVAIKPDFAKACILDDPSRVRSLAKFSGDVPYLAHEVHVEDVFPFAVDQTWVLTTTDIHSQRAVVTKVDDELGLIFGWAIVSTIEGMEYFDKQGDHIPEDAMMEAATDFMMGDRRGGDMHLKDDDGEKVSKGTIVFAWPLTAEIAKAFNIETDVTGLMIAYKPSDPEIMEKFKSGEYTGFSIGGFRDPAFDEEVVNAQ